MSATEAQLILFDRRYRAGLCRYCGEKREDPGRIGCNGCRDKQKARARKRYREGSSRESFTETVNATCFAKTNRIIHRGSIHIMSSFQFRVKVLCPVIKNPKRLFYERDENKCLTPPRNQPHSRISFLPFFLFNPPMAHRAHHYPPFACRMGIGLKTLPL